MGESSGKAEYLIQESGCGMFQVLIVILVNIVSRAICAFALMFMAFGSYNPGWRCADDNSTSSRTIYDTRLVADAHAVSVTSPTNETVGTFGSDYPYTTEACPIYKECQNIEFDPQTLTIVTEWGLLCESEWIPSVIISIQMCGVVVGAFLSGQLGDTFGRKKLLYMALTLTGVSMIVSIFAPNWEIFAALKFVTGVALGCLFTALYLLPAEYPTSKWRSIIVVFPSWHIGGIMFGVTAMICKDWRLLHVISGGLALVSCLSALWVPESLRWLEVKKKDKEFKRIALRLISMNKLKSNLKLHEEEMLPKMDENVQPKDQKVRIYTILDIFRKGFGIYSAMIGFLWLVPAMIYYAIGFGVKAMYGGFYINLIIIFAVDVPFAPILWIALSKMGRRTVSVLFFSIATTCLLTATGFELWASSDVKNIGALFLYILGKVTVYLGLNAVMVLTSEIYPTVVRGTGLGYAGFMCRVGGIAAPFLIPRDKDSIYICYGIMAILSLICCVFVLNLPETKGKELKEYFDEIEDEEEVGVRVKRRTH